MQKIRNKTVTDCRFPRQIWSISFRNVSLSFLSNNPLPITNPFSMYDSFNFECFDTVLTAENHLV